MKIFSHNISAGRLFLIAFTAVYSVAAMLLHVEASHLLTGRYKHITGDFNWKAHSFESSIIVLVLVIIYLGWKLMKGRRRFVTMYYWGLYAIILFLFYLFISLHAVELIHLIQYSIVAILVGYCIDPKRDNFLIGKVLFIGISLGIMDELLQYYIVSPGHQYLDFNDFIVNTLGTISGSLLFYGFREPPTWNDKPLCPIYCTRSFAYVIILSVVIAALFLFDYLQVSPPYKIKAGSIEIINGQMTIFMERIPGKLNSWLDHFTAGHYYAFGPTLGMATIFFLGFIFATFDPRFIKRFSFKRKDK